MKDFVEWRDANGVSWQMDADGGDVTAVTFVGKSLRASGAVRVAMKTGGARWLRENPGTVRVSRGTREDARLKEPETCLCGLNCARLRLEMRVPTQDVSRRTLLKRAFAETAHVRPCQAPARREGGTR